MDYIRLFNNLDEYDDFISNDFLKPNLSYIIENNLVKYNKLKDSYNIIYKYLVPQDNLLCFGGGGHNIKSIKINNNYLPYSEKIYINEEKILYASNVNIIFNNNSSSFPEEYTIDFIPDNIVFKLSNNDYDPNNKYGGIVLSITPEGERVVAATNYFTIESNEDGYQFIPNDDFMNHFMSYINLNYKIGMILCTIEDNGYELLDTTVIYDGFKGYTFTKSTVINSSIEILADDITYNDDGSIQFPEKYYMNKLLLTGYIKSKNSEQLNDANFIYFCARDVDGNKMENVFPINEETYEMSLFHEHDKGLLMGSNVIKYYETATKKHSITDIFIILCNVENENVKFIDSIIEFKEYNGGLDTPFYFEKSGEYTVDVELISEYACSLSDDSSLSIHSSENIIETYINDGIEIIGQYTYITKNNTVNIPKSVKLIENYGVSSSNDVNNISIVICQAPIAPKIYTNSIYTEVQNGVLKVPNGSDYSSWVNENTLLGQLGWTIEYI